MRIHSWDTVQDFFDALNAGNVRYVVISHGDLSSIVQKYEDTEKAGQIGYWDIDILCEDVTGFIETSKIIRKMIPEDDIHFVTFISEKAIPVDLRHQGDNYYDFSWEIDILDRRRMADNGNWYVMSEEDYYYTLVYHAILQKREVDPQYIDKLNTMAKKSGLCAGNKETHLKNLNHYMKQRGYRYVQPDDASVPFQWKYVDRAQRRLSKKATGVVKSGKICKFIWGGGISFISKIGLVSVSERMAV